METELKLEVSYPAISLMRYYDGKRLGKLIEKEIKEDYEEIVIILNGLFPRSGEINVSWIEGFYDGLKDKNRIKIYLSAYNLENRIEYERFEEKSKSFFAYIKYLFSKDKIKYSIKVK